MSNENGFEPALCEALARARARAVSVGLSFTADLRPPAPDTRIASLERELALQLPADLRRLLSCHDGMIIGTAQEGDPWSRVVFRVYSCAEIVEQTEYLRRFGYPMRNLCAIGAWDGSADRYLAMCKTADETSSGGVLDASHDDPTSFDGPPDYPDVLSWLDAVLADIEASWWRTS